MADTLPTIPGNLSALVNECRRLRLLAGALDDIADGIGTVRTPSWSGTANDYYEETRAALVKHWQRAADAHHDAADHLDGYTSTLADVQRLRHSVAEDVRATPGPVLVEAAIASIGRWQEQLSSAGMQAARALREARDELATIRRLLPEPLPPHRPQPVQPPPAPPSPRWRERAWLINDEVAGAAW